MRVRFVSPSAAKRIGGIDSAIEGLRNALTIAGVDVVDGGDVSDTGSVHHFHGLWDISHSVLAAKLRVGSLLYVVSPHGMLEPWALKNHRWKKRPYFWLIERRFLLSAHSIFVTSQMEHSNLCRVFEPSHVNVLPLGCQDPKNPDYHGARQRLSWRPHEKIILFLSRIDIKKGLDLLLLSVSQSEVAWRDWRLVIVGEGEPAYVASLKGMCERRPGMPQLEWVGSVWGEERWAYLQGADLFCLPTHSENFGIAILEALHSGTPVLTTDQTPWRDFVGIDGVHICEPNVVSVTEGLAIVMERLKEGWTGDDRRELANWAKAQFGWPNIIDGYIRAYRATSKSMREKLV